MRNPFRHPRQPDAAAMHAQQVARLTAELDAARATIARQVGEIAALTMELERAQGNYQFHFAEYRRNCNAGGKHQ
jgi:hypothetical protein